jgi:hypothetical protein
MLADDCPAAAVVGAAAEFELPAGEETALCLLLLHAAKPRTARQVTAPMLDARIEYRTAFMAVTS